MKTPLPIVKLLGKNAVITDTICLDGLNKSSDFTEVPENELLGALREELLNWKEEVE